MSLTASMWTGVSGLMGHSQKMNVVGNNIANVSTVGFKGQRMDFADFMYANQQSLAGNKQVGRGVRVGTVMTDFSQGAFETTNSAIDLAIGGAGFFGVKAVGSEEMYYTRAGNLSFTKEGYLTDPNGYAIQGWKIDNSGNMTLASLSSQSTLSTSNPVKGTGVPTDVRLDTWTVPPQQTTQTSVIVNLSNEGVDNSKNYSNPFASLIEAWDGTQQPPISEDSYAYATSIKVYDAAGVAYTMTVYYDLVSEDSYDSKKSETMWEYMVTIEPAADNRQVFDANLGAVVDLASTKMAGVLMSGTMTYNESGTLIDQSAYTMLGNIGFATDANGNPIPDANYVWNTTVAGQDQYLVPVVNNTGTTDGILQSFYPASISSNGYPLLCANFGGVTDAQTTCSPSGTNYLMEFNIGLKSTDYNNPWTVSDTTSLFDSTVQALNGGDLTKNKYKVNANSSELNVVETNPAFDEDLLNEYLEAQAIDIANSAAEFSPGSATEAWRDKYVFPGSGVTAVDLMYMTWPYFTSSLGDMTTYYFQNNATDRAKFQDYTATKNDIGQMTSSQRMPNASTMMGTAYSTSSGTSQNGYTFGNLTSYDVDSDGILYGIYSNGVTLGLYQITLYDFVADQGLYHEGNNLYSETRDSGEAHYGAAGSNGLGVVASYSLESSNVDMSREFVNMITTQRGFQANSKIITTTDTMMEQVIQMKR